MLKGIGHLSVSFFVINHDKFAEFYSVCLVSKIKPPLLGWNIPDTAVNLKQSIRQKQNVNCYVKQKSKANPLLQYDEDC